MVKTNSPDGSEDGFDDPEPVDVEFEPVSLVHVGNGKWVKLSDVKFLDIEEDMQGHDLATFIYNDQIMQSKITTTLFQK